MWTLSRHQRRDGGNHGSKRLRKDNASELHLPDWMTLTRGQVRIGGVDLSSLSDDEITRYRATRMGYVFQSFNLLPVLTAVENVEMPLLVSGVPTSDARRKALDSLDLVGSWTGPRTIPRHSRAAAAKVTIARALVNQPEIVWADEPTGNLDSGNSEEIMRLLDRMNRGKQPDVRDCHSLWRCSRLCASHGHNGRRTYRGRRSQD